MTIIKFIAVLLAIVLYAVLSPVFYVQADDIGITTFYADEAAQPPLGYQYLPFSFTPAEGFMLSLTQGALPEGLRIATEADAKRQLGEIYGAPLKPGKFAVTIRATETAGRKSDLFKDEFKDEITLVFEILEKQTQSELEKRFNNGNILKYLGDYNSDKDIYIVDIYDVDPEDMDMVFSCEYKEFIDLWIDGALQRRDVDYKVKPGSTVITVFGQTLGRLDPRADHVIAAEFKTGGQAGGQQYKLAENFRINVVERWSGDDGNGGKGASIGGGIGSGGSGNGGGNDGSGGSGSGNGSNGGGSGGINGGGGNGNGGVSGGGNDGSGGSIGGSDGGSDGDNGGGGNDGSGDSSGNGNGDSGGSGGGTTGDNGNGNGGGGSGGGYSGGNGSNGGNGGSGNSDNGGYGGYGGSGNGSSGGYGGYGGSGAGNSDSYGGYGGNNGSGAGNSDSYSGYGGYGGNNGIGGNGSYSGYDGYGGISGNGYAGSGSGGYGSASIDNSGSGGVAGSHGGDSGRGGRENGNNIDPAANQGLAATSAAELTIIPDPIPAAGYFTDINARSDETFALAMCWFALACVKGVKEGQKRWRT